MIIDFLAPYILSIIIFMPISIVYEIIRKLFGFKEKSKPSFLLRLIRNNKLAFALTVVGILLISLIYPGILHFIGILLGIITAFSGEYYVPGRCQMRCQSGNPEYRMLRENNNSKNNTYIHDVELTKSIEHDTTFPEYNPASGSEMIGVVDTTGNPYGMHSSDHSGSHSTSSLDHSNSSDSY